MEKFELSELKMLGDINVISDLIDIFFITQTEPQTKLPSPLVYNGSVLRSGLSSQKIASRIISRQRELGIPTGDLPDGSLNISEQMEIIRIEEILNALLTEAKIQIVLPPGVGINTTMGPGMTIDFTDGFGIIS